VSIVNVPPAPPWYESNLLWGPAALGGGILLTVVAAMKEDLRWLLWLALPCFLLACWTVAKQIKQVKLRWAVAGVCFLGVCSGLYWTNAWLQPVAGSKQSAEITRLGYLSIEWHKGSPPALYPPPDGRIFMLQTWPVPLESGGGGLGEMSGAPGQNVSWPLNLWALQCKVTNYSVETIFNVRAELHLTFQRAAKDEKHPGTNTNGDVFLSRSWPISIPKIDTGPDHAFVFYVTNFKDDVFVDVSFPKSVIAQLAGEQKSRTMQVIQPPASGMTILAPFADVSKPHPAP